MSIKITIDVSAIIFSTMKGVVLAGGHGTRLYPVTYATNKHLLHVYDRPMVFYPIDTLVRAGIKDVLVVTGGPHAGHFIRVLKNGKELGLDHIEYAFQEETRKGIAGALELAEDFSDSEPLCVILGDNCTDADISKEVQNFKEGALIFLKEVEDPQRFGVPTFNAEGSIVRLDEKPDTPGSNFAITGLYMYDHTVFDKIRKINPSGRGELEITDVNKLYLEEGRLRHSMLEGYWQDTGTFEALFRAEVYWREKSLGFQGKERR